MVAVMVKTMVEFYECVSKSFGPNPTSVRVVNTNHYRGNSVPITRNKDTTAELR